MDDTAKYLIHASIAADGVVERSDVVGAVFGQTEGLLGEELDLRDLQQSSKVGRIDVEIESENGQSFGHITIASSLDRVETAILAASLETIDRVGPCQASVEVTNIEDVREAKRREVVERAKELLAGSFDESIMDSTEILEEVRESVRIEDIAEYHGLPAGPHVADSDAIIVVEGRADVLTLLRYGIKNAIAVEGTNVPDAIADLTERRTVTAFLDGDRGGELILRELAQVGDVDYVVFAPENRSVEDLARHEVMSALREKAPFDGLVAEEDAEAGESSDPPPKSPGTTDSPATTRDDRPTQTVALGDGATAAEESTAGADAEAGSDAAAGADTENAVRTADTVVEAADAESEPAATDAAIAADDPGAEVTADDETDARPVADAVVEADSEVTEATDPQRVPRTQTLRGHVREVVEGGMGTVRLLDDEFDTVAEAEASSAFETVSEAETVPYAVVIDGELTQRVLDVAAQRGVEHVVARSTAEMVKTPVDVRVRTVDQLSAVD